MLFQSLIHPKLHPIAYKFNIGELEKPTVRKQEFFRGGFFAMEKNLKTALKPYHGAFAEYSSRTEDLPLSNAIGIMWDYVTQV